MLGDFDGVIVPGGFGESGIEGKLKAIKFVRENKIPYLSLSVCKTQIHLQTSLLLFAA